ncbi:prephenate dehydrogenase/arogenate dehydrogenase family protein [Halomarina oriensis]|uniref:Prephenate dehydrogenase/arogenate dehydrogenase family protein n=1 Tax=Halomarina oriensis TaxID=671145 RepID=A0A6B0GML8_9EURY|nr:prephenate dehydrogenase/arogenate dehydrogenase family protein [Halomarina oriensis]
MHCCIVGAGEMGTWVGRTLADAGHDVAVADLDADAADRAATTVDGGTVPVSPPPTPESTDRFDAVVLAVPIPAVAEAVAAQAPRAEHAVVDVTGVMGPALDAMREHAPDHERLSLHPMFSTANAPGRIAAVPDATGRVTDAIREALVAAGNEVFETTATDHDEAMETVQAKAHAAVLAYGLVREAVDPRYHTDVSTALFEAVESITGSTAHVFGDIQAAFDGAEELAAAAERVAESRGDPEAFATLYEEAGRSGGPREDEETATEGTGSERADDAAGGDRS